MHFTIDFPETSHPSLTLPEGTTLSRELSVLNSPLLFGCRTGICGTCLVEIVEGFENLTPPKADEAEALTVYAPKNPRARLACQLFFNTNIALKKIEAI
jgi:ferredoxin